MQILVDGIMGNICVELFEFGPVIQDMLFKDLSTFTSCSSFVQLSGTIYANFGRWHYGEHLCGII